MPYTHTNSKGNAYVLHGKETAMKNGNIRKFFYFGKEATEHAIEAVPVGYMVSESKNGLPVLKKIRPTEL